MLFPPTLSVSLSLSVVKYFSSGTITPAHCGDSLANTLCFFPHIKCFLSYQSVCIQRMCEESIIPLCLALDSLISNSQYQSSQLQQMFLLSSLLKPHQPRFAVRAFHVFPAQTSSPVISKYLSHSIQFAFANLIKR